MGSLVQDLARYRSLCEANGLAKATGARLPKLAEETLGDIEARLRQALTGLSEGAQPGRDDLEPPPPIEADSAVGADSRQSHDGEPEQRRSLSNSNGVNSANGAVVFCDGACIGNPGVGGYGAIVRLPGEPDLEVSGGTQKTTNNQMELTAAIVGIRHAIERGASRILVQSDSEYLIKGATEWVSGWQHNGWLTRAKEPVKNRELWEEIAALGNGRQVDWSWTKGHAGNAENERCDQLAVAAAERLLRATRRRP